MPRWRRPWSQCPAPYEGTASANAFARLTAEPYATITQAGTEHGLEIAGALREFGTGMPPRHGLFAMAQGMGRWAGLAGSATQGTSGAHTHGGGVLGGVGVADDTFAITAFVGTIVGDQTIGALGASTTTGGVVFGANARFSAYGLELDATVATDDSRGDTNRALPDASRSAAHYTLRTLVVDASAGYRLALGSRWALAPGVGYTHLSTQRGTVVETGSPAFDLSVSSERANVDFADADLRLERQPGGGLRPWLRAGVRERLSGDLRLATGALAGADGLTVAGVSRQRTLATVGAGIGWEVSPGALLTADYAGEFDRGGDASHAAHVGIQLMF